MMSGTATGSYKAALEAASAVGVLREISLEEKRFVCYTRYSETDGPQWLIGASDGVDVWRIGLSEQDVKDGSRGKGQSGYLSDISHTLESGRAELLRGHGQLTLCLKCASEQLEFSLSELSAAERRLEMQSILFSVWDKLTSTQTTLSECQKQLSDARKQKVLDQPVYADVSMQSGSKAATRPKKPAGHSLVNPSSKRRKAATGVVFGED